MSRFELWDSRGVTFDPPVLKVFEELKQEFGGK
jgi:hypothetical protein